MSQIKPDLASNEFYLEAVDTLKMHILEVYLRKLVQTYTYVYSIFYIKTQGKESFRKKSSIYNKILIYMHTLQGASLYQQTEPPLKWHFIAFAILQEAIYLCILPFQALPTYAIVFRIKRRPQVHIKVKLPYKLMRLNKTLSGCSSSVLLIYRALYAVCVATHILICCRRIRI